MKVRKKDEDWSGLNQDWNIQGSNHVEVQKLFEWNSSFILNTKGNEGDSTHWSMVCLSHNGVAHWTELIWRFTIEIANRVARLTRLPLWKSGYRVRNKSSFTTLHKWFWNLSRLDSKNWVTSTQIWQPIKDYCSNWANVYSRKSSKLNQVISPLLKTKGCYARWFILIQCY